jgi:DNA-binding transcriptional regulator LsrR (DeoR family)
MARKPQPLDLRLLSRISKLYYEQNLTQQEISEKLLLSRPKVSRLLQQALEEGVVRITVHSPPNVHSELEEKLEERYGMQEVVIADVIDPEDQDLVSSELGISAAAYLQRTIQDRDIIGISWGTTLGAMVSALEPMEVRNVQVVQMIGGLGFPEAEVHATSLARRLTQLLNSKLILLNAPGIVDNYMIKSVIWSDSNMQRVFELFSRINVAFVGIGAPTPNSVVVRDGTIINQHNLENLRNQGAVGDIALRFFDRQGRPVITELDERVIGITLDQLKRIPRVVGIAGGPQKREVVRAVLEGNLINVLVTDHQTAVSILDLETEAALPSSLSS